MSYPYQHLTDQDTASLLRIIVEKLCCISDHPVPQYTTTERNALTDVPLGKIIYNTSTNKLNVYTGSWEAITSV